MAVKKKILSYLLLRVFSFISPYCFLLYIIRLIKSIADDQRFFREHMYTFIYRLNHENVVFKGLIFQNSKNFNNGKLSRNCHHYMLVQSDVDKNTIFLGSFPSHIYNESVTPVESIRQHPWTVGCSELIQVIWFWCRIMADCFHWLCIIMNFRTSTSTARCLWWTVFVRGPFHRHPNWLHAKQNVPCWGKLGGAFTTLFRYK